VLLLFALSVMQYHYIRTVRARVGFWLLIPPAHRSTLLLKGTIELIYRAGIFKESMGARLGTEEE
jgi:hypothetical protein